MFMEAEKSHYLLSASWSPRKLVVKFRLSLKTGEPGAQVPEGRRRRMSQVRQRRGLPFLCLFVLVRP